MLEVSALNLGYGARSVARFEGVSLPANGECLLLGASGSGKTTLIHTLAGLLRPLEGSVTIDGQEMFALPESARDRFRGQRIGLIFQTLHLMPALSVIENLHLASYAAGLPISRGRAEAALERLGMIEKRDEKPERLSQGQRQRVAIARAIVNRPAVILADEPTSSLDDETCAQVIALIKDAAKESGAALVISTHDARLKPHFPQTLHLAKMRVGEAA